MSFRAAPYSCLYTHLRAACAHSWLVLSCGERDSFSAYLSLLRYFSPLFGFHTSCMLEFFLCSRYVWMRSPHAVGYWKEISHFFVAESSSSFTPLHFKDTLLTPQAGRIVFLRTITKEKPWLKGRTSSHARMLAYTCTYKDIGMCSYLGGKEEEPWM